MKSEQSSEWRRRAQAVIPGGVNSPVRAFKAVGGTPVYLASGKGARVWDVDGNEYLDYLGSWGPLILGHAHDPVLASIHQAARRGTTFGASTAAEVLMAERLVSLVPSMEKVRLVNSGTEATMSALRLARAATGRDVVVKMDGCYHGHSDGLLVKAGSGGLTFGVPDSAGVPAGTAETTWVVPYNDPEALRALFARGGERIAAVIVEPVAANMGVVPPAVGYLEALREMTRANGALLIFDEVITGFRLGLAGAQGFYEVMPDLTCLGKIIGGGLPVGAYGGRSDLMDLISPQGPVYQAGTLSGNPLAVAAGLATLEELVRLDPYAKLERLAVQLTEGISAIAHDVGVPATVNQVGSLFTAFFTDQPVTDLESAKLSDSARYGRFHRQMLERGIYLAPSQFEATFVGNAHTAEDIDRTLAAVLAAMRAL